MYILQVDFPPPHGQGLQDDEVENPPGLFSCSTISLVKRMFFSYVSFLLQLGLIEAVDFPMLGLSAMFLKQSEKSHFKSPVPMLPPVSLPKEI